MKGKGKTRRRRYWVTCGGCGVLQNTPNGVGLRAARQLKREHDTRDGACPQAVIERYLG